MKLEISKEQCMAMAEREGDQEVGAGFEMISSGPRPYLRPDGIPTRADLRYMSRAELAIMQAMKEVEMAGASVALTDAVNLLSKARDRVADHVEGQVFSEESCPGHIASGRNAKVCARCGTHVDSLRPDDDNQ